MIRHRMEPANRFLDTVCAIVERENRPGNTVTFVSEVDLSEVEGVRRDSVRAGSAKPSYTAFVTKAVAHALQEFPYANRRVVRFMLGRRLQTFTVIDAAILCERDLPDAPMVAFVDTIRDARAMSLDELTGKLRAMATCDESTNAQWRAFTAIATRLPSFLSRWILRLPELSPGLWTKYRGGAFVVSSPAKYGVDIVATTWPYPLGVSFGLVRERAVVREGKLVSRPTFMLTLNWDRRVMAGAQAARFFKRIVDGLEHAESELARRSSSQAPAQALTAAGTRARHLFGLAPA